MFKEADANGNGEIEFEEFVKLIAHRLVCSPQQELDNFDSTSVPPALATP